MDLTASGLDEYPGDAASSDKLIGVADQAMYQDLHQICNRVNRFYKSQEKEREPKWHLI
jgi:hypothetical protein